MSTSYIAIPLALVLAGTLAQCQTTNFAARHDIPALTRTVVVGDVNGDGIPDIVRNDDELSQVCTYFGNGDGSFRNGPCTPLNIGDHYIVFNMASADFNRDGRLDLAFSTAFNMTPGPLYVVFGNGDGTFGGQIQIGPALDGAGFITADLNGDGKADVVTNVTTGIVIVPGNGDGTFEAPVQVTWPSKYGIGYPVEAGDLSGHGRLDLIAGVATGMLVLENQGAFRFRITSFVPTVQQPVTAALGDLNGDGHLDLAIDCLADSQVLVALGNGNGTFGKPVGTTAAGAGGAVLVGDVNGDGKLDVVTANFDTTVTVLLGKGDGSFGPDGNYTVGSLASGPVLADLRGTRRPDYVIAGTEGTLSVLLNRGDGRFFDGIWYNVGAGVQTAAGDFNGDGKPDLAFLTAGGLQVLFGTGHPSAPFIKGPVTPVPVAGLDGHVAAADFNVDGRLDVALSVGTPGTPGAVVVVLGNGDGTFGAPITTVIGIGDKKAPGEMVLSDFNEDGVPDIASMAAPILIGKGDGTFTAGFIPTDLGVQVVDFVAVGDLNNDGTQDLVFCMGNNDNDIISFLGNGDGTFGPPIYNTGTIAGPTSCFLGDFNGDGFLDVGYSNQVGDAGVILGNGDGTFRKHLVVYTSPYWYSTATAAIGDFNGDGNLDIAVALPSNNTVAILQGKGDGTFDLLPVEFGVNNGPGWMTAGSFQGNPKRLDLAVSNADGTISVLTNTTK